MRNLMKTMIAFFAVILIGLAAILTYALVRGDDTLPILGNIGDQFTGRELVNTQNISLDGISGISIKGNSCDVIFLQSESDEMIIKEYVSSRNKKESFVTASVEGKTLNLKANKNDRTFFVLGSNYRYFEVYLPESFAGALDVDTNSGDISADTDLMLTEMKISSSSGYVNLQKVTADTISIETSSGDVNADALYGEKDIFTRSGYVKVKEGSGDAKMDASSGDITVGNHSGHLDIKTSSGYVKAEGLRGSASVNTSSGDVRLEFIEATGDLEVTASSGYIICDLPEDLSFDFQAETNSGEIITNFDDSLGFNKKGTEASGTVGETADISVKVKTSSGDIKFHN